MLLLPTICTFRFPGAISSYISEIPQYQVTAVLALRHSSSVLLQCRSVMFLSAELYHQSGALFMHIAALLSSLPHPHYFSKWILVLPKLEEKGENSSNISN